MSGKLFRKISLLLVLFVCLSGKIYSETYYRLKAGSTGGDWTDNTIWQKYNDDLLVQDYEDCTPGDYPGNTASNDHVIWIPGDTDASLTLDYDAVTVQKICFNSDNDTSHNKLLTINLNGYDLTVAEFDLGQIEASPLHGTDSKLSLINTDPDYDSVVNITNLGADPSANITLSIGSGVYVNVTNDITIGDDDTTTFTFGGDLTCNGDIVINSKVIICNDTAINAGSKNITFNGDVDSDTSSHSLTLNGAVITQNKVGFGSTSPLEDLRITVSDRYEGVNDASITAPVTCNGDLTLTGVALFRGDISAATITSSAECQFLAAVTSVETTGNQTYNGNVIINYEGVNITSTGGQITFNETFNTWSSSANPVSANFSATKTTFVKTVGETTALKNISITGNAEFGDSIIAQDITVTGNADFASNVTANDIIVTGTTSIKGTISANDVEFTGDTTLTGDTTFITTSVLFSGEVDSDGNDLTLGNNTTATTVTFSDDVIHTSTLTLYGATTVTGTATINVNEWNNPNDAVITPGSSTVTVKDSITGNNNFYNLTTTGTSLIFEAGKTQTIAGTFTAADTTLESSTSGSQWTIDVATANATVSGVTVKDSNSVNLISPTGTCTNLGNNINWAISSTYRWKTTAASTDWTDVANWQLEAGASWIAATRYPGQDAADSVKIVTATSNPAFNLASDITLSDISIGSSTDTTAELDFTSNADIKLSASTSPVTNYGTIIYSGTGRIKNDDATPAAIMDGAHGTVEFTGSAAIIDDTASGTAADYYNLKLTGLTCTLDGAIKVAGKLTVDTASSITGGTSLAVTGTSAIGGNITTTGTQIYTGDVTLNDDITFIAGTASTGSTVQFAAAINTSVAAGSALTIGSSSIETASVFAGVIGNTSTITTLTIYGDTDLQANATVQNWNNANNHTVTPNSTTVTVTENVSGDNTFSNLVIDGTGTSIISGSNTIENFTCTAAGKTLKFGAGKTQTISGDFVITGTSAANISLLSTSQGSTWTITTPVTSAEVSYALIEDSTSTNDSISPIYSRSLGNNVNWTISNNYKWNGSDTDWKT
ncbi:hypothetical protein, partial [Treponema sp.]|uniref:beta strand repeat-containing protein n=1 Tax=Treponema sp. TaxID=166 RepID=UPI00298E8B9F